MKIIPLPKISLYWKIIKNALYLLRLTCTYFEWLYPLFKVKSWKSMYYEHKQVSILSHLQ
jgi:hypothetical protein